MPKKPAKLKSIKLKDMASILGKASRDARFRRELLGAPAKTLKAHGFEPHPQAVSVIKSLKHKSFGAVRRKRKPRDSHGGGVGEA